MKKGLAYIELLIIVAILFLLTAIYFSNDSGETEIPHLPTVERAIENYSADHIDRINQILETP